MPTQLTLAAHQGGNVFGPFDDAHISLGADPQQCHIALHVGGIYPVHAWLSVESDQSWILQPSQAQATIFVRAANRGTPSPVQGSARLGHGDSFILGSPEGPTFTVTAVAAVVAPRGRRGRKKPTAGDFGREIGWQAQSAAMRNGPFGQVAQLFFRAKSGALTHPRVVIGALIAFAGVAFTLCSGVAAFLLRH